MCACGVAWGGVHMSVVLLFGWAGVPGTRLDYLGWDGGGVVVVVSAAVGRVHRRGALSVRPVALVVYTGCAVGLDGHGWTGGCWTAHDPVGPILQVLTWARQGWHPGPQSCACVYVRVKGCRWLGLGRGEGGGCGSGGGRGVVVAWLVAGVCELSPGELPFWRGCRLSGTSVAG